jgi:hypothetical protein
MGNGAGGIFSGIKKVFGEVEKPVEVVVSDVEKTVRIFNELQKDSPELKAAFTGLVGQLEAVGTDITGEVTVDGLNLPGYLKLAQDSIAAVRYFQTNVKPVLTQVWGQLDPTPPTPEASSPAASAVDATTGPGLHAITPA